MERSRKIINFAGGGLFALTVFASLNLPVFAEGSASEKQSHLSPPLGFSVPDSIRGIRRLSNAKTIILPQPEARFNQECEVKEPVSFYNLAGSLMANGEPMDPSAYTAAIPLDKYLRHGEKIGDSVKITDPEAGTSAVVRLTDRGMMASPGHGDKYLDVAEGVARDMGWKGKGVVSLCYEVLPQD